MHSFPSKYSITFTASILINITIKSICEVTAFDIRNFEFSTDIQHKSISKRHLRFRIIVQTLPTFLQVFLCFLIVSRFFFHPSSSIFVIQLPKERCLLKSTQMIELMKGKQIMILSNLWILLLPLIDYDTNYQLQKTLELTQNLYLIDLNAMVRRAISQITEKSDLKQKQCYVYNIIEMFSQGKNKGGLNTANNSDSNRLNHFQSKLRFKFNPKDPRKTTISKSPQNRQKEPQSPSQKKFRKTPSKLFDLAHAPAAGETLLPSRRNQVKPLLPLGKSLSHQQQRSKGEKLGISSQFQVTICEQPSLSMLIYGFRDDPIS